jgi:uncharacterized membrane protein (UPF0127 family)
MRMSGEMRIVNRTRGTRLGERVMLADTWWGRFRGFLGRIPPIEGEGILLSPCDAIHTWGMGFALDVVFLDSSGSVLAVRENVEPWSRPIRVAGARHVLEVPPGTVRASGTLVGDACSWSRSESPRLQETS